MGAKKQPSDVLVSHSLKDLRKIIKKKKARQGMKAVSKVRPALQNEEQLFDRAMREVQEIKEFRKLSIDQKRNPPECKTRASDRDPLRILEEIVQGQRPVNISHSQEYIQWINRDYHDDIINRLHKGTYAIQDCLDLHGLYLEDAERIVDAFIRESIRHNLKCIKIIHGRGLRSSKGPVLKDAVVQWLSSRYRKHIVAFVTARQCDGGLGALYVLLR